MLKALYKVQNMNPSAEADSKGTVTKFLTDGGVLMNSISYYATFYMNRSALSLEQLSFISFSFISRRLTGRGRSFVLKEKNIRKN